MRYDVLVPLFTFYIPAPLHSCTRVYRNNPTSLCNYINELREETHLSEYAMDQMIYRNSGFCLSQPWISVFPRMVSKISLPIREVVRSDILAFDIVWGIADCFIAPVLSSEQEP